MKEISMFKSKKLSITLGVLFILSACIGYFGLSREVLEKVLGDFMENVAHQLLGEDGKIRLLPLFFNNLRATLVMILLGFVPFLYLPFLTAIINGMIIGVVLKFSFFSGLHPF